MNFFNSTSLFCQEVTSCTANQIYNYLTNSCSPINPNYNGFPDLPVNTNSSQSNGTGILTIPQINCVNGQLVSNSTICICYKGWTDSDNQTNTIVNKCDLAISGFNNQTNQQN